MAAEPSPILRPSGATEPFSPALPASPNETSTAIIHYYRGEMGRMASWRDRIDRTSNWAITVVAALLSVSLSTPSSHHGVIIFAMLLISLLLLIEARRYRFFDVYRARVRRLERSYFAQILSPQAEPNLNWAGPIAQSLRNPVFLMSYRQAFDRRLKRNYCWMYFILLLAWVLKIFTSTGTAAAVNRAYVDSWHELAANANFGPIPGWAVIAAIGAFYVFITYATFRRDSGEGELSHGEVHV
ncbi:DUF2270 domain-containing protein [Rhizobiaceae bacterium n13]|uniref:DUF2270 domain-containing protein n=1 Tax=Ferirhizobium litorale TaxID=2927786 RepID=A0AAE3U5R3_9HYPH|nr:DUF2270 domain-containing protein [Fererhizobium litorale]MDI7863839.1 DUF2270 domain-containing protein [Fererhizobium litorale]MDI7924329.1 DUF2270 domain-containing protein [Fererhizobium litorale]